MDVSIEQGGVIRTKPVEVRGGASLYEASGNLEPYKNMFVMEDPHKNKNLKIGRQDDIIELAVGESNFNLTDEEVIRIQIRLAIKSQLEKQYNILKKGYQIKVLTLFFIDAVNKIRDNSVSDGRGEYLTIFDEEYAKIVEDAQWNKLYKEYPQLFPNYKDVQKVREGYFAVDKNKHAVEVENWDSILDEQKLKAKSQEDIDRGIELILEKKDELISFNEPLAFIFSHSALREGWDNPNVFTICALKRGGSEIAKKQEIGRGLRLPVDIHGSRCVDNVINELTVIANDSYEHFAEALQKDFNEQSGFNKDEVTADIIYNTLRIAGIPIEKLTTELVDVFRQELLEHKFINDKNVLTKEAKEIHSIVFKNETLKEHAQMIREKFVESMLAKGTKKIPIKNGDEPPVDNGQQSYISEDSFLKLLKELSLRMSKRTMYQVNIDSEKFIEACVIVLNDYLAYKRIVNEYNIETGKAQFDAQAKFVLADPTNQSVWEAVEYSVEQKSEFEIINYIMYHTLLPRLAIFKIISQLTKKVLLKNQDILDAVTQRIKKKLRDFKASGIAEYKVIDGYVFSGKTIFEAEPIDRAMLEEATNYVYETKASNRRAFVSSQVKPATFRHKPYNILVLSNSLSMLKSVAVTCHVYNFAVMNKSI